MLGYKQTSTSLANTLGIKNNFHRYLGNKIHIQGSSRFTFPRSPSTEINNDPHTEYDPKIKYTSEKPRNVLRVKKSNKPNDGFSNFL